MTAEIDPERLRKLLNGINSFGLNAETGGFNRPAFSPADTQVRRWFEETMRADGLAVRSDAAGNLFGRFGPAEGPALLIGSHLDTVIEGGAYDGALGVAVALETVRAMQAAGGRPATAIEVVATSDEEGRFGGMLGSQAIIGAAPPDWVAAARDASGVTLIDAMAGAGLDATRIPEAARNPQEVAGFLELHIEQGPVLEARDLHAAAVTEISGVCVLEISLTGQANHSGTTPMEMRADAFSGLAEIGAAVDPLIAATGTDQSRITIGKVVLHPNDVHTIPGRAEVWMVIRDTSADVMHALRGEMEAAISEAADRRGLRAEIREHSWLDPVRLDESMRGAVTGAAQTLGIDVLEMPSGAGHDAQTMQALCPSGLIFVQSRGGISHAPQEDTPWEAIVTGARLFLRTVCNLTG